MSAKEYTSQVTAQIPTEQVQKIDGLVYNNHYSSRAQFIKEAINEKLTNLAKLIDME